MKNIINRLSDMVSSMVSSVGQSQGEATLQRYCLVFLYEPEIPHELLEEQER